MNSYKAGYIYGQDTIMFALFFIFTRLDIMPKRNWTRGGAILVGPTNIWGNECRKYYQNLCTFSYKFDRCKGHGELYRDSLIQEYCL